ncbi:spermidine synthase [Paraburkholderia tropica]|uniref:Spermidine synthase n=1 Tax=Paraburkholderia tropica TaxID=92647 RepID=A0ABX5MSF9_9BURK|nr:spermidine synthase [Paraburkholderia tropica]PZW82763.1 spermidine synthase [Paraburkholderia tropica]
MTTLIKRASAEARAFNKTDAAESAPTTGTTPETEAPQQIDAAPQAEAAVQAAAPVAVEAAPAAVAEVTEAAQAPAAVEAAPAVVAAEAAPAVVEAPKQAEVKPAAKRAAKPVAKPEAKPVAEVAAKAEAKPVAKKAAKPAVKAEAKPVAKAEAKPVVKKAAKPAVKAEVKPVAKPAAEVAAKAEAKPVEKKAAKPAVKAEAKPAAKVDATPVAKAEAKPVSKKAAKPAAKAEAKPAARVKRAPVAATVVAEAAAPKAAKAEKAAKPTKAAKPAKPAKAIKPAKSTKLSRRAALAAEELEHAPVIEKPRKPRFAPVTFSEEGGVRYLHFGTEWVQGAMRLSKPQHIELEYAQQMMAWLLFLATPARIVQLGLGAAALTKFAHRYLRPAKVEAIELNPAVVVAARTMFDLPMDDARLAVRELDAWDFVQDRSNHGTVGALQIDIYDATARGPVLDSVAFYRAARACLAEAGVATINLFGDHPSYVRNMKRLKEAFDGRVIALPEVHDGNRVALAFSGPALDVSWTALEKRARMLESKLGLPAHQWVKALRAACKEIGKEGASFAI